MLIYFFFTALLPRQVVRIDPVLKLPDLAARERALETRTESKRSSHPNPAMNFVAHYQRLKLLGLDSREICQLAWRSGLSRPIVTRLLREIYGFDQVKALDLIAEVEWDDRGDDAYLESLPLELVGAIEAEDRRWMEERRASPRVRGGSDFQFFFASRKDYFLDDPDDLEVKWTKPYRFGLLWLACFRQGDLGRVCFSEDSMAGVQHLVCELEKARFQFEDGLNHLEQTLYNTDFYGADGTNFPREFRKVLHEAEKPFVHVRFAGGSRWMEQMLSHALTGFYHPGCDLYYSPKERVDCNIFNNGQFVLPADSGVMSVGGALKRLCDVRGAGPQPPPLFADSKAEFLWKTTRRELPSPPPFYDDEVAPLYLPDENGESARLALLGVRQVHQPMISPD